MLTAEPNESDEAYAQRLQAVELGLGLQRYQAVNLTNPDLAVNANTPLMALNRADNPTIIDARLSEIASARVTVCAIFTVFGPQILAALVVLSQNWNETGICDSQYVEKWKYWAALSATRMFAYLVVVLIMHTYKNFFEERPQQFQHINSVRNVIDALGLIWFVVGNMWIFAEDDNFGCRHPEHSPIYGLCVAMLIINYVQICLPCIAAIIVIPIFCFCMPCLIQVLARLHNPRANRGAPPSVIDSLPVVVISAEHSGEEPCPICLKEMTVGEEARQLRCKHLFHKECVDTWLHVNATCPTCRKDIVDLPVPGVGDDGSGGGAGGGGTGTAEGPGGTSGTPPHSTLAVTRQRASFNIEGGR